MSATRVCQQEFQAEPGDFGRTLLEFTLRVSTGGRCCRWAVVPAIRRSLFRPRGCPSSIPAGGFGLSRMICAWAKLNLQVPARTIEFDIVGGQPHHAVETETQLFQQCNGGRCRDRDGDDARQRELRSRMARTAAAASRAALSAGTGQPRITQVAS